MCHSNQVTGSIPKKVLTPVMGYPYSRLCLEENTESIFGEYREYIVKIDFTLHEYRAVSTGIILDVVGINRIFRENFDSRDQGMLGRQNQWAKPCIRVRCSGIESPAACERWG